MPMSEEKASFEGWCVLELMGHRKLAGYVREQAVAEPPRASMVDAVMDEPSEF